MVALKVRCSLAGHRFLLVVSLIYLVHVLFLLSGQYKYDCAEEHCKFLSIASGSNGCFLCLRAFFNLLILYYETILQQFML